MINKIKNQQTKQTQEAFDLFFYVNYLDYLGKKRLDSEKNII